MLNGFAMVKVCLRAFNLATFLCLSIEKKEVCLNKELKLRLYLFSFCSFFCFLNARLKKTFLYLY